MLSDDADLAEGCRNLAKYSRRELIPLIISDIPRDELSVITDLFRYVDATCYDDDDDTFFVKVNNEAYTLNKAYSDDYLIRPCDEFKKQIIGQKINNITTRGKWIVMKLDKYSLLVHINVR